MGKLITSSRSLGNAMSGKTFDRMTAKDIDANGHCTLSLTYNGEEVASVTAITAGAFDYKLLDYASFAKFKTAILGMVEQPITMSDDRHPVGLWVSHISIF